MTPEGLYKVIKVLLIVPLTTLDWGTKNAGGVDSVCQMIVSHLIENASNLYQYRVLAFDLLSSEKFTEKIQQLAPNVELIRYPANEKRFGIKLPGFISQSLRVHAQLRAFQPHIAHAHLSTWLLGVPSKYNRVATMHAYKKICRNPVSMFNDFIYTHIMPSVANNFIDKYVCVGDIVYSALIKDTDQEVTVIGNPIDNAYFVKRSKVERDDNVLKLVTCALISRRKCIHDAILFASEVKASGQAVKLTVIGPNVDDVYYNELKTQVLDLGMLGDVVFLGALQRNEIIERYKESDVGVFFSNEETFGLVPLEMLATGLPVISTIVGVLKENKDYFSGVGVSFLNIENDCFLNEAVALTEGVKEVDVNLLRENYAVDYVVEQYECVYRELLVSDK